MESSEERFSDEVHNCKVFSCPPFRSHAFQNRPTGLVPQLRFSRHRWKSAPQTRSKACCPLAKANCLLGGQGSRSLRHQLSPHKTWGYPLSGRLRWLWAQFHGNQPFLQRSKEEKKIQLFSWYSTR